ncbi:MAG: hypothetical protein EZS28_028160 [Streblomastix strix]|uniref:Uncharacterized protein n=1 Tax=Streblomastix strix TaxID=222440 RepID=A0A5J4V199_9EUKA|nr:MAG: hypothetical protein EZS28_028160 [Streblomastix strix]
MIYYLVFAGDQEEESLDCYQLTSVYNYYYEEFEDFIEAQDQVLCCVIFFGEVYQSIYTVFVSTVQFNSSSSDEDEEDVILDDYVDSDEDVVFVEVDVDDSYDEDDYEV